MTEKTAAPKRANTPKTKSPKTGPAGRKKSPPKTDLERAITGVIASVLKGGAKPRSMRLLAQFAGMADEILMLERSMLAGADPGFGRRPRLANGMLANAAASLLSSSSPYPDSLSSSDEDDGLPAQPAYASPAETWATRMVRELVSGLFGSGIGRPAAVDPEKLVHAVAAARNAKLPELADKLEKRLVDVVSASSEPPATTTAARAPKGRSAKRAKPRKAAAK